MLAHLLAFADHTPVVAGLPNASAITISSNPGFCNFDSVGDHATLTLNFSVANQTAGYSLRLLESGGLVTTLALSATSYVFSTPGDVENAGLSQVGYTFNFDLQIIRDADGVVMQDVLKSYSSTYGTCR